MFLTTHAASVILFTSRITNPWLAFLIGLFSHYVLDAIPHGDENLLAKGLSRQQRLRFFIKFVCFDIIITFFYSFFILTKTDLDPLIVLISIFGALLPDFLWGLDELTGWGIFKPHTKIHSLLHNPLKIKLDKRIGFGLQILILILVIYFLI